MDAERASEAPVDGHRQVALTDGGVETVLVFRDGFELPCFASFPLLADGAGRAALRAYFAPFLEIAERHGLPLVLDTATWRANPEWGARLGYDRGRLAQANRHAVAFARELADGRRGVTINGVVGPRGDGYVVGERMSAEQAADYHGWQIGVLCDAGVDQITGLTLTYPEEAIGIVRAAAARAVPVVAGMTVETDGRLPDGTTIAGAVERVDAATGSAAEFFLINCAHPTHIAAGLDGTPALARVGGLRFTVTPPPAATPSSTRPRNSTTAIPRRSPATRRGCARRCRRSGCSAAAAEPITATWPRSPRRGMTADGRGSASDLPAYGATVDVSF